MKSRNEMSKRNKIVGLDYSQTVEALNGIHFYTMDALRLQSGSFLNLFDSSPEARLAIANSLEHAKNQISKKILFVEALLTTIEKKLNQEIDAETRADLETRYTINQERYNTLESLLLNWDKPNGAISTYLDYLKQFAINLTEDSLEDALNYDESQSTKDLYAPKDTINQKAYMAGAIRLLVSSIAKVDGEGLWYNNLGFPVMLPFGQVYNLLVNKLSTLDGTTSPEELKILLSELASIEPGIAQLYEPFNGDGLMFLGEFAGRDGYIRPALLPFDQVENAEEAWFSDVNLLTQFIQTFAKYNYAYIIGYANAGSLNVTLIDATESAIKRRLESNWKSLKAQLSKHPNFKKFFTVENGVVYHNPEGLKDLTDYIQNDTSVELMQEYLNSLGLSLSPSTAKHISQNVALFVKFRNLYNAAVEKLINAQPKDLDTFIFPHELTTFLIEQEIKYGENIYENSHFNFEGNRVFNNNLHSYMSVTISKMEKVFRGETTVDAALPHLSQANNPKTSLLQQWLEQGPKAERTIKFGVMEGISLANELNGIPYAKMSPVDRILVKYRMMQQGKYEMIRPADASQNRYIDIQYPFLQEIALTKTLVNGVSPYQSQVIDLFVGYLRDELMQVAAVNTNYSHFKNNHNNKERFILAPMLKGITIDWENKENFGPTDFAESILTEANLLKIRENFDNMLAAEVDSRREFLIDNRVVIKVSDDRYYIGDLFTTNGVGSEANLKSLNNELTILTLNDWISTIEQYNIFFGGVAHYKNLTHSIKRIKGTVGTKKLTLVGNWLNNFINTRITKINNLPHLYDSNGQPLVRTVVVSDPMVISSTALYYAETLDKYTDTYINLKEKISKQFELDGSIQAIIDNEEAHDALIVELSKEANELLSGPYFDITESDGFGILSLDAYRTLLIRNGSWSTAAEKLYQWEVQEYNNVPINQRKYVDLNTGMESKLTYGSWGNHVFNSIKPQYFGPMANVKGFVPTFYKMLSKSPF